MREALRPGGNAEGSIASRIQRCSRLTQSPRTKRRGVPTLIRLFRLRGEKREGTFRSGWGRCGAAPRCLVFHQSAAFWHRTVLRKRQTPRAQQAVRSTSRCACFGRGQWVPYGGGKALSFPRMGNCRALPLRCPVVIKDAPPTRLNLTHR